jgi:ArsR family transcriptional regulator
MDACCAPIAAAPLGVEDAAPLAEAFRALADPVRLRLLSLVAACDEVCACDLVEPAGRSQPTVSHHLKVLREAGLVTGERRGPWVWYRVVPERLAALRDALDPRQAAPAPAGRR